MSDDYPGQTPPNTEPPDFDPPGLEPPVPGEEELPGAKGKT